MNTRETATVLAHLGAAYQREVEPDQVVVWEQVLAPFRFTDVDQAARGLMAESKFFPTPAEVVSATNAIIRSRNQVEREHGAPTTCGKCDGTGWAPVGNEYVQFHMAEGGEYKGKEAALTNTVMPCPSCRPVMHFRWSEGHFAPNHSCGECLDLAAGGDRARKALTRIVEAAA